MLDLDSDENVVKFNYMKPNILMARTVFCLTAFFCCASSGFSAGTPQDLVREALMQQSPAQRAGCFGVQRSLKDGSDATLVVRTAIEVGFNTCQVIRCALEGKVDPEKTILCDKVVRGAVLAGALPDVITRCTAEYCSASQVAGLLGDAFLETNYCYLAGRPTTAPDTPLTQLPVHDRSPQDSEASPFRF